MSDSRLHPAAIVVLAAGSSSRMGSPKQMLDLGGRPLLRHAASVALTANCGPVFVVLGSDHERLRRLLDGLPLEILVNDRWQEGIGTSIRVGVDAVERGAIDRMVLTLADQPFVTAAHLTRLVTSMNTSGATIVASAYAGTTGVPAAFARPAFSALSALAPDAGCKRVIHACADAVLIECPEAAIDIDTPADYHSASERLG